MDNKESCPIDGIQLLKTIANKAGDIKAAQDALAIFAGYFETKIMLHVEVIAKKYGFGENVAFEAIQCAFAKVWYYPSFDMKKSHYDDPEKAIVMWLIKIAVSQMFQFTKKGECKQITDEEDLSVIESSEEFVSLKLPNRSPEEKIELVRALNKKLSALDEKHRIIYLTYKAYQIQGKKLPRSVLDKLRKRLCITQATVRVYKREACEALNDYKMLES